jgi:hypothetical protein
MEFLPQSKQRLHCEEDSVNAIHGNNSYVSCELHTRSLWKREEFMLSQVIHTMQQLL